MTTTTAGTPAGRTRPLGRVGAFVEDRVVPLQKGYLADRGDAVRVLAQLRRGAGKAIEDVPELWGLSGGAELYAGRPPKHGERWPEEVAAHIALSLYALHQQSRREAPMHRPGRDLGGAVRRLMPGNEIDEPLRRRFIQAGTANGIDPLAYRLREIVVLLRRDSVQLDYGLLADQLCRAQSPGGMAAVRGAWGRGFHAYRARDEQPAAAPGPDASDLPDTPDKDS